ncbi:sensor domain-containing diguanylate cyclase [Deinococcus navajonensis]|uniref:Diguanylate cyclase domain-containing protein n=1 Tax=Deinococcus navajonensis TaxID=309884 RepID=A0ABV8XRU8_9DEIO
MPIALTWLDAGVMAERSPPTAAYAALEQQLLWVPFSSVLWGLPLYLVFFVPPAWEHLVVLGAVFVVFGLALFGPGRLRAPLRRVAPHLYGAVLLTVWTLGFYVLPAHPASPTGLLCTTLLAPVVYVLLFVQRPPERARWEGGVLLLALVLVCLPHALRTLGRPGGFDGPVLPLTLLGAHGALLGMLHHFSTTQLELTRERVTSARLHTLAHVDTLTGLGNRRAFDQDLAHLAEGAVQRSGRLQIAIIDLDGLKHINDTYGHAYGDELLATFGQALREAFSAEAHLYRFGGDEFALLMEWPPAADDQTVREAVHRAVIATHLRGFPQARASTGVAQVPDDGHAEVALRLADARMYAEKEAHRRPPG